MENIAGTFSAMSLVGVREGAQTVLKMQTCNTFLSQPINAYLHVSVEKDNAERLTLVRGSYGIGPRRVEWEDNDYDRFEAIVDHLNKLIATNTTPKLRTWRYLVYLQSI